MFIKVFVFYWDFFFLFILVVDVLGLWNYFLFYIREIIIVVGCFICLGFEEVDWRGSCVSVEMLGFILLVVKDFSLRIVGLCCVVVCF